MEKYKGTMRATFRGAFAFATAFGRVFAQGRRFPNLAYVVRRYYFYA